MAFLHLLQIHRLLSNLSQHLLILKTQTKSDFNSCSYVKDLSFKHLAEIKSQLLNIMKAVDTLVREALKTRLKPHFLQLPDMTQQQPQ